MVATDDDGVAEQVRLLRSHGMTTLTWGRHRGHAAGYDVVALGFNYRIDEPRAALGRHRLERLDAENAPARAARPAIPRGALRVVRFAMPWPLEGSSANHLFTVVLDDATDREAFRSRLAVNGVQTSVHYPAVHRFSAHRSDGPELR